MELLNIAVLAGTIRKERRSIHAARLVVQVGKEFEEIAVTFVDPQTLHILHDGNDADNKDPLYSKITKEADGFFIVTPEYNHSFPGSLKRMLDTELKNYIHKPVAFGGVSEGPWGGVRAIEALVTTVREMGMTATFTDVHFPNVEKLFDEQGNLLDQSYIRRIKRAYTELIWMATVLKWGRTHLADKK